MKKEIIMDIKKEKPVTKVCVKCITVTVAMIPIIVMIYFLLTSNAE